jgi:hypothetical protein
MIDLKEAMEIAKKFIIDVNGDQENFLLEEISLSNDKARWEVVYSYSRKQLPRNELQEILGLEGLKTYKKVVIDNETKDVLGLYNRSYERQAA